MNFFRNKSKNTVYLALAILGGYFNCSAAYAQEAHIVAPDSIVTVIAKEYDEVGLVHRYWLGDSYRKLYNTPVKMPIMDLSQQFGGLQVVKLGGGMQTQSLRLADASGREWVLRSIQKYPERSLPENLRKTIAKDIVQDQISIANPFGALTVPPFNRALKLPHAVPILVYVGDDPQLEEYRDIFKNRAYMFESRVPLDEDKTDNTAKVQRKVEEDNDTQVDQALTLRARLLDFILGDWDRHEDNWRWAPEKIDGEKIYTPVPRDRDKVYYKTSGVFPTLLSYQWLKAHLQPFSDHIRNVGQWNFNARHFDRYFLNKLDKKDWEKQIAYVQKHITDSLIDVAMAQMPDTIVKLNAESTKKHIQARRDDLNHTGLEYYHILAKYVDIPASAKNEFITADYHKDGSITVEMRNRKKDGTEGRKIVKRRFYPNETQEIRLYGLGGSDYFELKGKHQSPIKLRLIGGDSTDHYNFSPQFTNQAKVYIYDDKSQANSFVQAKGSHLKLSNDTAVYAYDRNSFKYDRTGVLVNGQYSVDKGLFLGAGYLFEKQGFRKNPYAYKQEIWAHYYTGRESFVFNYKADFKSLIGKNDLLLDINYFGPSNQENFFGLGNNTEFEERKSRGIHYYRNRYDHLHADIFLKRDFADFWRLKVGSSSELYISQAQNNKGRFFEEYKIANPEAEIYGHFFFTGAKMILEYDSRDNIDNPKKGMHWISSVDMKTQFTADPRQYLRLNTVFSFNQTNEAGWFTIANRTGFETIFGDPLIFQYAQLGGDNSLRGFNSRRFTGNTMAYNNLEFRFKVLSFTSYLIPGTVGLLAFNDVGRVWLKEEKSDRWHVGYGGGFYFIPADLLIIQAAGGFSKEGFRPYISMGLRF